MRKMVPLSLKITCDPTKHCPMTTSDANNVKVKGQTSCSAIGLPLDPEGLKVAGQIGKSAKNNAGNGAIK